VVETLRLVDGTLFSIPVNLDVSDTDIERLAIKPGARLALRDPRDEAPLAIITGESDMSFCSRSRADVHLVEDIYKPDKVKEAEKVFGANDRAHPSVAYLHDCVHDNYIGGKVQAPIIYFFFRP